MTLTAPPGDLPQHAAGTSLSPRRPEDPKTLWDYLYGFLRLTNSADLAERIVGIPTNGHRSGGLGSHGTISPEATETNNECYDAAVRIR